MKKAVLLPNEKKKLSQSLCLDIVNILIECGVSPFTFGRFNYLFGDNVSYEASEDRLFEDSFLAVVLGGDGSIIEAARYCAPREIPIIGVNLGRLGYLAQVEISDLSSLKDAVNGNCMIEDRIMLDGEILRADGRVEKMYPALNDIVLSNGPVSRLMSFDMSCDGVLVTHAKSDGIIISTPTGSSAYSMSAGGPVLDPTLDCICATPICAHSFGTRPIVFSGDSIIRISGAACRENKMYLTVDGRENIHLYSEDILTLRRSSYRTKLIRLSNGSFMNVLNKKMSDNF